MSRRVLVALLILFGAGAQAERLGGTEGDPEGPLAADRSVLAGKVFCRTIYNPMLKRAGHEEGEAEHCISFTQDGKLIDNGNKIRRRGQEKDSDWIPFPFSYVNGVLRDTNKNELKERKLTKP